MALKFRKLITTETTVSICTCAKIENDPAGMRSDEHFLVCTGHFVAARSEGDPDVCHADTRERSKVQKQRWGRHNCAKGSRNSNFQSHTHPINYIEDGAEVHCEGVGMASHQINKDLLFIFGIT
jgi:hypothetical protein